MAGCSDIHIVREMAITHAEFFRTLANALAGREYERQGREVVLAEGERRLTIALSDESVRGLGALRLPQTTVAFHFSDYSQDEVDRFMEEFSMHFQRGGG